VQNERGGVNSKLEGEGRSFAAQETQRNRGGVSASMLLSWGDGDQSPQQENCQGERGKGLSVLLLASLVNEFKATNQAKALIGLCDQGWLVHGGSTMIVILSHNLLLEDPSMS